MDTVPSAPMVTDCAVMGMVMAGEMGLPLAVTTLPWESSENDPSRV